MGNHVVSVFSVGCDRSISIIQNLGNDTGTERMRSANWIGRNNTSRSRSQWSRGLRRRSVAARLLKSWVRIPPEAWMFVCCECCLLSGRGLCNELITRPEESYRLWCVVVCDLETSRMRRPWPALGCSATKKNTSRKLFVVQAPLLLLSLLQRNTLR